MNVLYTYLNVDGLNSRDAVWIATVTTDRASIVSNVSRSSGLEVPGLTLPLEVPTSQFRTVCIIAVFTIS